MRLNKLLLLLLIPCAASAQLDPLKELRYCGSPARDSSGTIIRSQAVITAFRKEHPCPATMSTTGACTGWAINHIIPLACGGCDAVSNMQWLPDDIKSSSNPHAIDRFERKIYAHLPPFQDTANCVNSIVK